MCVRASISCAISSPRIKDSVKFLDPTTMWSERECEQDEKRTTREQKGHKSFEAASR